MDKRAALDAAYDTYADTKALRYGLADGRQLVKGAGPLDAPVLLVGEAPREQEEIDGEPFTGPAGQYLQKLFRRAEVPWELCYRTDTISWRLPGNRGPYPYEVIASRLRLTQEILTIQPEVVIAVGETAWKALATAFQGSFANHRGTWVPWSPIGHAFSCDLLAIYHPAQILGARGAERASREAETVAALKSILEGERVH